MKKTLIFLLVLFLSCTDDEGNPCVYQPTLTTDSVTNITETTATLNGTIDVTSENCETPNNAEQGFVYSTEIQPTLQDIQVNVNGTNISTTIEGLTPNTTYYVRAFLTNNLGDFYGDEVSFTTVAGQIILNTLPVSNITTNSATTGGEILSDGNTNITAKGVCWSLTNLPIADDNFINNYDSTTTFESVIEGLTPNTEYFVRAFATNEFGTYYGDELSFTTECVFDSDEDGICDESGTVTDIDGNTYDYLQYGDQVWTIENAEMVTYRDGTPIPEVEITEPMGDDITSTEWGGLTRGAWCYYNNDPSKPRLYNWYAVMGIYDEASLNNPSLRKEFAPEGWHVPSDAEWTTLENYLVANGYNFDGTTDTTAQNKIAKAMASTTGWTSHSNHGTPGRDQSSNNSSGFNAFPEGRLSNLNFNYERDMAFFWSSTDNGWCGGNIGNILNTWARRFVYESPGVIRTCRSWIDGISVRFVRD